MTTNLKIDNLEATSLKLNGQEIDSVVTPEELDGKIEEVEGKIDEKCAETLEDAKAYTDSKSGGGGFSVYVIDDSEYGTVSQNIEITSMNDFKSIFRLPNYDNESLIFVRELIFENMDETHTYEISYWCLNDDDAESVSAHRSVMIGPFTSKRHFGKIWYDSKNDRIWFENAID